VTDSKTIRLEKVLLTLWFIVNLTIGVLTVHEYGMSIDEPNNYRYADETLKAYPSFFGILYEPKYDSSFDGHGPAFVTITAILTRIIQGIFPNLFAPDIWHFSYFITFQLTGLCLYWLTRRWFNTWTAWGILILFSTQPLLLGHAFINPKDIPFMFFLTLSVVTGFRLVDSMNMQESFVSLEKPIQTLASKFHEAESGRRRKFLIHLTLSLAIVLTIVLFSQQINSLIEHIITFFYTASPEMWAGQIFGSVASPSPNISAADYVTKALKLLYRAERILLITGVCFFLAYFGLLTSNTTLSTFIQKIWGQRHKLRDYVTDLARSLRSSLKFSVLKTWFAEIFRELHNPHIILSGLALGLATAVRAVGPVAGLIVFLYLFVRVRSRAWTTSIAYFLVAAVVTYLSWPRLWGAPIPRYLEGLGIISNFSNYPGQVLFDGRLYGITELPRSYLPILLNIQFTEPLLLSVYVGLGVLAWRILHSQLRTDLLLYICLGFAFPMFGLILLNSPLYHNFRQTLFLIPAMFMLAAFALELVFSKMPEIWARVLLIGLVALPGVYSSVRLYPYEYVYYNSLVGGPAGARNRYELDYWRISLREAALQLNELAPQEATIIVTRSAGLFARYARRDLIIDKVINSILDLNSGYDYVVQLARGKAWDRYPELKNVIIIERDGAVLAAVKAPKMPVRNRAPGVNRLSGS
jgi:4-amino-4-deoxy-L-arabinose transferase-like glycosyltransferase